LNPKKEVMVKMNVVNDKGYRQDKSKQKEISKGWMLAEEVELDERKMKNMTVISFLVEKEHQNKDTTS
jgi:endo-beta-N-acetylglucosaminidase D